jgi:DNA replication protein DnaC
VESCDAHEFITEHHCSGSMICTSNYGPDEWVTMFASPMRAQSAIDRLTGNAYDRVIDDDSSPRVIAADTNRAVTETRARA